MHKQQVSSSLVLPLDLSVQRAPSADRTAERNFKKPQCGRSSGLSGRFDIHLTIGGLSRFSIRFLDRSLLWKWPFLSFLTRAGAKVTQTVILLA